MPMLRFADETAAQVQARRELLVDAASGLVAIARAMQRCPAETPLAWHSDGSVALTIGQARTGYDAVLIGPVDRPGVEDEIADAVAPLVALAESRGDLSGDTVVVKARDGHPLLTHLHLRAARAANQPIPALLAQHVLRTHGSSLARA